MRFFENGPSIPDRLLVARDEGRVIFFCGAGVSRARAGLDDFFGLAQKVTTKLGVPYDHPAIRILEESSEIDEKIGVKGLVSADRVFGLLERDFDVKLIESAVAEALTPEDDADLSAHKIILDLSTTNSGNTKLVTTNFDRLFEKCCNNLDTWIPPRLPNPNWHKEISGVTYLHGCVDSNYSKAEGDGFVLSSSTFGRAYLSDGWATSFIQAILQRYIVVFVGYSADDPPVQYLLEALNDNTSKQKMAYAFQSGESSEEVSALWNHKGVEAIAFNKYHELWETLEAWAQRAIDVDSWYENTIKIAQSGPAKLSPHERGQVAHIFSTIYGMRKIVDAPKPPPADWLGVFDPYLRYSSPGNVGGLTKLGPFIDPFFDRYGLDTDLMPEKELSSDIYHQRETPEAAWSLFDLNEFDRSNFDPRTINTFFYSNSSHVILPKRLGLIGHWFGSVSKEPTSVWWASRKTSGLAQSVQNSIQWQLNRSIADVPPPVYKAWQYLFEYWNTTDRSKYDWYDLKLYIDENGLDALTLRQYLEMIRPLIKAGKLLTTAPLPPKAEDCHSYTDLINLEVHYPHTDERPKIPKHLYSQYVSGVRKNLEHAVTLEKECTGAMWIRLVSLNEPDEAKRNSYKRSNGLSAYVLFYCGIFLELFKIDKDAAIAELQQWSQDKIVFSRLKIWACKYDKLISPTLVTSIISQTPSEVFWGHYHQRDVLITLSTRWSSLKENDQKTIEQILFEGPKQWEHENAAEFIERKATSILERLIWMKDKGCKFSFNFEQKIKELQRYCPSWHLDEANNAARSFECRGGFVETDKDFAMLLDIPLKSILSVAKEETGRKDLHIDNNPYLGLSEQYPVRAFSALTKAGISGDYPEWAWRIFLTLEARKNDKARFAALIAERLAQIPQAQLVKLLSSAVEWLNNTCQTWAYSFPKSFEQLIAVFFDLIEYNKECFSTSVVRNGKTPDWPSESLNSPLGKLVQAVFQDPKVHDNKISKNAGFPPNWLKQVEFFLTIGNDLQRYALVLCCYRLNWFYYYAPNWTEQNLIAYFDLRKQDDSEAAWEGFLWRAKIPSPELYRRIKTDLLRMATTPTPKRQSNINSSAFIILAGWGSIDKESGARFISDSEFKEVLFKTTDEFRCRVLWQIEVWAKNEKDNAHVKWSQLIEYFLANVWPKQKRIQTISTTKAINSLVFSQPNQFDQLSSVMFPLLSTVEGGDRTIYELARDDNPIVQSHPTKILEFLKIVLPQDVEAWPYETNTILESVVQIDPAIKSNAIYLELKATWDQR